MTDGPAVVFVYDHFYPDYSAGGPVTSLANLANLLAQQFPLKIITSARIYESGKRMNEVSVNGWSKWKDIDVWYATDSASVRKAIETLPAGSVLYLNGIFSPQFFLYPLWLSRKRSLRAIITPRGMLQRGALENGSIKKRTFIKLLTLSGLHRNAHWHATDTEERNDIQTLIKPRSQVTVIANVPKAALELPVQIEKKPGQLRLVYFSLISAKKNLLFLLELLRLPELQGVTLDIAGPIKDQSYWRDCLRFIDDASLQAQVRYVGEVEPYNVSSFLSQYHVFVLPTLGENFGHAIMESFGAARPVLISDRTPWKDVNEAQAGRSVPLEKKVWCDSLIAMRGWDQFEFDKHAGAARRFFDVKINFALLRSSYSKLFTDALR
jgi:glycosyltransferase involved in cell wall biosynthesis